jgi:hypothetical protein
MSSTFEGSIRHGGTTPSLRQRPAFLGRRSFRPDRGCELEHHLHGLLQFCAGGMHPNAFEDETQMPPLPPWKRSQCGSQVQAIEGRYASPFSDFVDLGVQVGQVLGHIER